MSGLRRAHTLSSEAEPKYSSEYALKNGKRSSSRTGHGARSTVVRARRLRQAEPEHVDRRPEIVQRQAGRRTQPRAAPVGEDRQPGADDRATGKPHPGDAPILFEQSDRLGRHPQRETRVATNLACQKVEEMPVRHHRGERRARGQVPEVRDSPRPAADHRGYVDHLVVRQPQERVQQPEIVNDVERRRMERCRRGNRAGSRRASPAPSCAHPRGRTAVPPSSPPVRRRQ